MEKRQEVIENGRKKLGNKGFSLVELIVVIAIMAILTVVIAPQFMRYIEKSRESVDVQTIDSVKSALQAALADEDAWDSIKTDVYIDFANGGDYKDASGTVIAKDRAYTDAHKDLTDEINENLNKTVAFKSDKYKAGVKFKISAKEKEVSFEANAEKK